MDLTNKIVWVTGASSGIGEAICHELMKYNCKIVLSSRRESELLRVKNELKIKDENVLILPIDLEKSNEAENWVEKVIVKFGRIDFLINNGGISQKSLVEETTEAVERKVMEINYFGNVALAKAVSKYMIKQKSGKIIVTTSILGKFGLPFHSTYAASKHALYGFYDSFRLELKKDNVSVLLVSPGFINTNVAVNSITGDGSTLNEDSPAQINGMKTNVFARKLVGAIKSDKNHIFIGSKELLSIPFKTFSPNLFYSIMLKLSKGK
ncbi:SDR family oxidoreductase [Vicingus serpentipes]|uniref:SDR family oxidoreductase n=1 Tax=Vicingus serpentipes TaxID=1926625 RepID=A0A5C6RVI7_9FLAO|nr:SDR family oxidoreductase [Vicingus serpentipes]TXB65362.1 SDR family oxidoreductase [Vicingus serpentipes]